MRPATEKKFAPAPAATVAHSRGSGGSPPNPAHPPGHKASIMSRMAAAGNAAAPSSKVPEKATADTNNTTPVDASSHNQEGSEGAGAGASEVVAAIQSQQEPQTGSDAVK